MRRKDVRRATTFPTSAVGFIACVRNTTLQSRVRLAVDAMLAEVRWMRERMREHHT